MKSGTAEFQLELDLTEYLRDKVIISQAVCYDGTLAIATTEPQLKDLPFGKTEQPGWASFPATTSSAPYMVTVQRFGPKTYQRVQIAACESAYPIVQIFPDDSILLVSSRCRFKSDGPELNACIYSGQGELMRKFCLGDGINNVQVSRQGEIWVSYFDEGVFGNFGWNEPMGAPGLCCFDRNGTLSWAFTPPAGFDMICDCYAMTLAGENVWICYYTDFPVARIDKNKRVTCWTNKIAGAHAIACNGYRVLLYGGYGSQRNRCIVQTLAHDGATGNPTEYELLLPGLEQVPVLAHGSDLHAVVDSNWYRLSLNDLN